MEVLFTAMLLIFPAILLLIISNRMFVRIVNALGFAKGILLKDSWGEIYYTLERKSPWDGSKYANVYPVTATGHVILNSDGTTSGESTYIKEWKVLPRW